MKPYTSDTIVNFRASPPVRGAWIETFREIFHPAFYPVAPRAGGVD